MITISELFIYPIKSLGGIAVETAELTDRGFALDRRWMLVDRQQQFMTQRQLPAMALFRTSLTASGILVSHQNSELLVPFQHEGGETIEVTVWDSRCQALPLSAAADRWFSEQLNKECRLVYMPDSTQRLVNPKYAQQGEITSFSDAYPTLLIGQASLDDLNSRMPQPLPMNRFRPNIVCAGSYPYEEDELASFRIRAIEFRGVKLCDRCVLTTINQDTGNSSKEPLKTLATYRQYNRSVYFGQNLLHNGRGTLEIGDQFESIIRKPSFFTAQP